MGSGLPLARIVVILVGWQENQFVSTLWNPIDHPLAGFVLVYGPFAYKLKCDRFHFVSICRLGCYQTP